jgi:hypothetical protein
MEHPLLSASPDQLLSLIGEHEEFDRGGRIRIYRLCEYIKGILDGTIKVR